MLEMISRLSSEEHGQDLIEYALLSALLAIACILGILQLTRIREFFAAAGVALDNAI
jgi:Flp pilus assembly pilin Flp